MVNARNIRLTVTSCAGRWRSSDLVPAADRPGCDHRQVRARSGVGREGLQPAPLPHPTPEGGARDPSRGHLQHHLVADLPPLADPGFVDLQVDSGQVLTEEPVRELTAEPGGPPVQILALEGVHGLTVAAVVLDVADEVADHAAAQTAVLGSRSPQLHRTALRLLADAGGLGLLVRVGLWTTHVDRAEIGHRTSLVRRRVPRDGEIGSPDGPGTAGSGSWQRADESS